MRLQILGDSIDEFHLGGIERARRLKSCATVLPLQPLHRVGSRAVARQLPPGSPSGRDDDRRGRRSASASTRSRTGDSCARRLRDGAARRNRARSAGCLGRTTGSRRRARRSRRPGRSGTARRRTGRRRASNRRVRFRGSPGPTDAISRDGNRARMSRICAASVGDETDSVRMRMPAPASGCCAVTAARIAPRNADHGRMSPRFVSVCARSGS